MAVFSPPSPPPVLFSSAPGELAQPLLSLGLRAKNDRKEFNQCNSTAKIKQS